VVVQFQVEFLGKFFFNFLKDWIVFQYLYSKPRSLWWKKVFKIILISKRNSNVKDRNCIFGEFWKLYLQKSFEENKNSLK